MTDQVSSEFAASPEQSQEQSNESQESSQVSDQIDSLEQAAADPNLSKAEKKEVQKMIKKLKIKVDSVESEEELPFEIPDTEAARKFMTEKLQFAKKSHKTMQDKAAQDKMIQAFFNDLKTNPRKVLSNPNVGVNFEEMVDQYVQEQLENAKKSPEQLQREQTEAKVREREEAIEKERAALREERESAIREKIADQLDMEVNRALETQDIPKTSHSIMKITDYMIAAHEQGQQLDAASAAKLYAEDLKKDFEAMVEKLPIDKIKAFLGPKVLKELAKANVAQVKAKTAPLKDVKDVGVKKTEPKKEEVKETQSDFFRKLGVF